MTTDERWMQRAIKLADRGRGWVEPNPPVGCVMVRDGQVVAEGHHARFGGPHAEAAALSDGPNVAGATAFVTLEPCCHSGRGKKTPPCAPRLIEAKVSRVVIGCRDPNPRVSGGGIATLRRAGIDVVEGVLGEICRRLIEPFRIGLEQQRPFVTLKWAVSADGRVAGRQGRPVRITSGTSDRLVQELRSRCDAIAVGTNTVINDDPRLTVRVEDSARRPLRVVFSNSLRLPRARHLWSGEPTLLYTHDRHDLIDLPEHVEVVRLPGHDNGRGGMRFAMLDAYEDLYRRHVTHLLVEPGPTLARFLIDQRLADRIWIFRGTTRIGDDGLAAPRSDWQVTGTVDVGSDHLVEQVLPDPATSSSATESSDLRLARLIVQSVQRSA
jgi:diaminohydroxyphosphoribosylaminopyrimidine deaminase/5-amino-6-(5-phosphoribosylamino)uracil reductase